MWVRLTGHVPGKLNEKFVRFVDAAHETLGSAKRPAALELPFHVEAWDISAVRVRKKGEWGSQVRKTLNDMARRLEADRADRYEKGFSPQSVGVQPSVVKRVKSTIDKEFRVETKRLNELMLEGDTAAARILWCEYEIATTKTQRRYVLDKEFGFNPMDALAMIRPGSRYFMLPPTDV